MNELKVGVIGVGYWGKKIVEEYARLTSVEGDVNVESICDLNEENLRYCRQRFGIAQSCREYEKLLAMPEIDAVNICTPNETHYQLCEDALNANKHVLLEKPMTLKASQAHELVRLANHKGLTLSVGHIFRFNNALRKARDLIQEGFLGDLYYLDLQWTTLLSTGNRDIVTDLAPHPFDIINFLTGMWPTKVTCRAKGYRRSNQEEVAFITCELDSLAMGHMHLSWLMPGKTRQVNISGSEKTAQIDCLSQAIRINDGAKTYDLNVEVNNTIRSELTHFLECVRRRRSGEIYENNNHGILGARVVELLEAARKSLEQNKTVLVDRLDV